LGATVFMLKYGHPPFVAGNLLNLYNKIQNDPLVFPPQMKISPGLQDLLENMLRKDPNERFTLDKVILHPWMRYPPPNPATAAALAAAANACADRGDSASVALAIPGIKARIRASPRVVPAEISADHVPIRAQFTPPDSYNDEEAAAMEGPVKEVNNEDMYKSIGVSVVGKTRSSRRKSKSSASSSACVSEKVSQHENMEKTPKDGESDMMLSGWGADVFEIIDVGESNNSDSDDDSDDEEDSVVATKHVTTAVNSFNVTSTRVSKAVSDKDVENIFSVVTVGEDEKEGSDSSSDEDKSKGKAVKEEIPRAPSRKMSEQLAPLAKYDMAGMDDTSSRGSMGADEENFRASRFRSQLSKRSIKEAISKEMRSKKNVLECLSSGRSSQMSSPFRIGTPPSNPARNLNLRPPGCVATPSKREVDGVASYVRTVDVEEECTGELSMEEFRTMMDTLATVGGPRDRSVEDSEADPVDLTLDALDFSSQLMNMNSGVGVAFHSEKGQREFQEDRCCLVPDVAEMNMREAMEQAGGLKSRRGSFLNSVQKETEDQLHKITVTCLFDGHSGSVCSEYLSKHFAKILVNHEKFLDSSPEAALIDVCRQIDGQVTVVQLSFEDAPTISLYFYFFLFL
jgi:serine/threonine protein kinase